MNSAKRGKPNVAKNPGRGIRKHGAVYELNIQRNGVRQWINLETGDYAQAIRNANEVRASPELSKGGDWTGEFKRFIAYKKRMRQYTEHSARTKEGKLNLMAEYLGENSAAATVKQSDLQGWHDALVKDGLHSSTVHGYLMSARAFFNWAVDVAKIRRSNPTDDLRMVRLEKRSRKLFCSFDERDRLIKECKDDELKFILYCGFHAGMRFAEIGEAVPGWFNLSAGRIDFRKTPTMRFKDNEERTVPLTTEFGKFLATYGLRKPYMIAPEATKGKWLYRYDFRAKFMKYVETQKLGWVTPHVMRHTFASLLVSAGESIYKVAVWLGDDVKTVQDHYGHLAPDEGGIEKAFSKREK